MVKHFSFGLRNDKITQKLTNQSHYFRLSEVAGARLRDKNPGISDLSDSNRPLKLNEKIGGMLYDKKRANTFREATSGSINLILITS